MDIIFKDVYGNKKNFLYQYDVGQSLVIENWEYDSPDVQFQMNSLKTTISAKSEIRDGALFCYIPDSLLTIGDNIIVYLYARDEEKGEVVFTYIINVIPRKRPSDYVYSIEIYVKSINGMIMADNKGLAEVANWEDGNSSREDRDNLFVSIHYENNERIVTKATSLDNVDGVTVSTAGFATNCDSSKLFSSGYIDQKYALVCSSGCAIVKDDGTCVTGQMCVPTTGGVATKSSTAAGYKVLDRIDSSHVYILVAPSMSTVNDFQTRLEANSTNLNTHKNNTSNPHKVSKSQVGLGNVPNVATNDQTPTYTVASTLTQLTSGEKLSTAFGKISKAIVDLIAHITNKSNPHEVTKIQLGLGNVDNTADADKPVSTATQAEFNKRAEDFYINFSVDGSGAMSCDVTYEQIQAAIVSNKNLVTMLTKPFEGVTLGGETIYENYLLPNLYMAEDQTEYIFYGLTNTYESDCSVAMAKIDFLNEVSIQRYDLASYEHTHDKSQVGLANVNNTSDANKPISTATQAALDKKADLVDGVVPLSQLPSQATGVKVVADISARDALTPTEGMFVHVKDATGDSTVESGYADYIYDGEAWVKIGGVYASADSTSY